MCLVVLRLVLKMHLEAPYCWMLERGVISYASLLFSKHLVRGKAHVIFPRNLFRKIAQNSWVIEETCGSCSSFCVFR